MPLEIEPPAGARLAPDIAGLEAPTLAIAGTGAETPRIGEPDDEDEALLPARRDDKGAAILVVGPLIVGRGWPTIAPRAPPYQ
jgi:hypothetical protein